MVSRAEMWDQAFEEWLHESPKTGAPRPASTMNAYATAWSDFRSFCAKPFWEVTGLDVRAWLEDLRTRAIAEHVAVGLVRNGRRRAGQRGLSGATINQRLTAISAFYSFAERYEMLDATTGQLVPLFDGANPGRSRMVKRPKPGRNAVDYLTAAQLRKLLEAILSQAERNPHKAKRDYALFLCFIVTGGRNSEIRRWQWRDLEVRADGVFYHWANKGKSGADELPAIGWQAVCDYLAATGRLPTMAPDSFVFVPLSDSATRLRRKDGTAVVDAAHWSRNRAISPQEINHSLRRYAELAGFGNQRLHIHCLRHSAYMLYRQAGLSLQELSRLLHHSSLAITTVYDHQIAGQRNESWTKAADLLGLGTEAQKALTPPEAA